MFGDVVKLDFTTSPIRIYPVPFSELLCPRWKVAQKTNDLTTLFVDGFSNFYKGDRGKLKEGQGCF